MKKLKIGITADFKTSLFSSGINQNAIYLSMLFNKMGHDSYLLVASEDSRVSEEIKGLGIKNIKTIPVATSASIKWDIVISLGVAMHRQNYDIYKSVNPKLKYVSYKCGNEFFTKSETIIYDAHSERHSETTVPIENKVIPDQVWSIPQMENTNIDYYAYTQGTKNVTVVPFVWDPLITESFQKTRSTSDWTPRDTRRIVVLEPNMSLMKNAIHPIMSVSAFLDKNERLDKITLGNSTRLGENKDLIKFIRTGHGDLFSKLEVAPRFPTLHVLENKDMVLSWQMENNLNYLYFDVVWHGYPLVHNANLCPDLGYYYKANDAEEAADQIKNAFENHTIEYKQEMRDKIQKYTIKNPNLIKGYKMLIKNLMEDNFTRQTYEWKTNTVSST